MGLYVTIHWLFKNYTGPQYHASVFSMRYMTAKIILMCVALVFSAGGAFTLPNCKGRYSSVTWTNCFGTETNTAGDKYDGEFRDGKRNGQGTFTWLNGGKYVGEYRDGKFNGQGTLTWPNGDKYVGEFRDGKRTGRGTYTWLNGGK